MRRKNHLALAAAVAVSASAHAAVPTWDKIVIVVEENKAYSQIIGSPSTPYINNTLVAQGTSLNRMHGITHPSQPNYLEFFSGSNQGMTSNNLVGGTPLSTPNLGAAIIAAGKTFGGYSEDLPAVGSLIENANGSDGYWRKHNPWSNWQSASPGANQLPASVNMPMTSFPTDYSTLPSVSIVVPNQANDMHNGTIAQGDAWLQSNLDGYYQWAKTHNSLLIVTFDEDDSSAGNNNRIATVFAGAKVRQGVTSDATWTLHNLLRTIEDSTGAAHSGAAANVRPIVGPFTTDVAVNVARFRQGESGYASARDTQVRADAPTTTHDTTSTLVVDLDDNGAAGNQPSQALIRFDSIIGAGLGQVPAGSQVLSAKLIIQTGSTANDQSAASIQARRMLVDWNASATWNTLGGDGVTNGIDAAATAEFTLLANVLGSTAIFDVSNTVQAWVTAGGVGNFGWALVPTGTDGWRWLSSESTLALRPQLEIAWTAAVPQWNNAAGGSFNLGGNWVGGTPSGTGAVANFLSVGAASPITISTAVTLGTINLNNAAAYTINGPLGITLAVSSGNAAVNVLAGSHAINAPITLASNVDIAIPAGLTLTTGTIAGPFGITTTAAGTLAANRLDLGALAIAAGGTVRLADSGGGVIAGDVTGTGFNGGNGGTIGVGSTSVVASLTLAGPAAVPASTLDVRNNDLVIRGGTDLDTLRAQVAYAYNGGLWDRAGLTSSRAAADGLAVGFGANTDLGYAIFSGVAVNPGDHLVKYTWFGDANLDGRVDGDDYLLWLAVFGSSGSGIAWGQGDFDYDQDVDGDDYLLWLQNFGNGIGTPLAAVPEPGVIGLAAVAAAGLLARRRRV